jgi:hypothetical protein
MNPTFPPRRTLLPCTWGGERRRGKVYVVLAHKKSDTPRNAAGVIGDGRASRKSKNLRLAYTQHAASCTQPDS